MIGSLQAGCRKCVSCLINRRRKWMLRIILERNLHASSCFVTLTYSDDYVPSDGSLDRRHLQTWLKRFRKAVSPVRVRFFAAGEYGEKTSRPHFHVALFGVAARDIAGPTMVTRFGHLVYCDPKSLLSKSWGMGFISASELTDRAAQYVAGYVTKKMRFREGLNGRYPEFSRMSLRPAVGREAVPFIAASSSGTRDYFDGDVPHSLRVGSRLLPIDRYLRGKLRQQLQISEDGSAPVSSLKAQVVRMQELRQDYEARAKIEASGKTGQGIMLDERAQKLRNMTARLKLEEKSL